MKKSVASLYSQTIANIVKLHDTAKHPESRQALTEAKLALECACIGEKGTNVNERDSRDTTER